MARLSPDDVTTGSIPRVLLVLAAPLVAQNLVHVVGAVVDTFWLGRLGEDAIAAVGLNFPVMAALFAALLVSTVGTHILVAQRVGAGRADDARRVAFNGVVLAAATGIGLAVVVVASAGQIMALLSGEAGVVGPAATYLATIFVFAPFLGASDTIENGFVGWGDARAALYVNLTMVGTNVLFDPLLIFGVGPFPGLGVQGAAMATGLGYLAGFCLGVTLAVGDVRGSFALDRDAVSIDRSILRELASVGSPIAGQHAASQSVRVLVVAIVAIAGGGAGLAAYTVGARVASVAFTPAAGLQQAAQSVIGQNVGADRPDRANRTTVVGLALGVGALGALGGLQWLVPGTIAAIFVPDVSPAGFELTVRYLEILAYGYPAIGASYVLLAAFNGTSRTRTSFVADVCKYWVIRLPLAVAAIPAGYAIGVGGVAIAPGLGWGVVAIFWAVTVSNVLAAFGLGIYYAHTRSGGMFERAADRIAAD
ncbi:MAG: MATE family efflux transporter [Halobacteriota archaeon]